MRVNTEGSAPSKMTKYIVIAAVPATLEKIVISVRFRRHIFHYSLYFSAIRFCLKKPLSNRSSIQENMRRIGTSWVYETRRVFDRYRWQW